MKNYITKMIMLAAAVTVATGMASAQDLKAEIPFAFRAVGKMMAPGTYRMTAQDAASGKVFRLSDENGNAVAILPRSSHDPKKEWVANGNAVMSFRCDNNRCTLVEVWAGGKRPAYDIAAPSVKGEGARMTSIALHPDKAE